MTQYINPQAKILHHPDRLAKWAAGETPKPIGVEIDLTNRCNEGCEGCHFGYTHSHGPLSKRQRKDFLDMGDEMGMDLISHILWQLKDQGVKSVTFSGGGEPTLHPHFNEIVIMARKLGLALGLYTNGTRIDSKRAALIKKTFDWVVVSLDAPDKFIYQQYKKVDLFDKACEGISRIAGMPGKTIVGVSYLIHEGNYADTWRMVKLSKFLGADYSEFRPLIEFDLEDPSKTTANTSWILRAHPTLRQLESNDSTVVIAWDKLERLRKGDRGYAVCHAILFTGVITPNGKMWLCVNRRGFPDSCIGDLNTESFGDVWARQKAFTVDHNCRISCRGDLLNVTLNELVTPLPHQDFI